MKRNVNKIFLNYFLMSKTVFAIFDIKKYFTNSKFEFYFWQLLFDAR